MAYIPAGYEDEYDSSDSEIFFMDGFSTKSQGNGNHAPTNGSTWGSGMATPSKLQRDQQGSPLAMDDFKTAASRGNLEEVQDFIAKGMAVDCMLKAGWTALMYAASCGQPTVVRYLLEKGANPNFNRASFMYSPLMAVCSSNLSENAILECLTLLTDHGADVNTHEKSHMTPLMIASQHGHARVVEKLLACGATVDYTDNRRWTALFYAAESGHRRVVELLLGSRADPTKWCSDGKAADIAYEKGHKELAELLEAAVNPATSQTVNGNTSLPPPSIPVTADTPTTITTTTTTTTTDNPPTSNSITNHHLPPPTPPPPAQEVSVSSPPVTSATVPATTTATNHQSYHVLDDLELFLYGLNLGALVPAFRSHEVTFAQLLEMTEDDVEKVGVSQVGQRKKIVDSIHAIHKKKWERGSVRSPSSKVLRLKETHAILDNVSKHIAYIASSIVYIDNNLAVHNTLTNHEQEPGSLKVVSEVSTELLVNTRRLHDQLRQLKANVNKAANSTEIIPADLIRDPDKAGTSKLKKAFLAITAVGLIALFCYKKSTSIRTS
ncbi:ankyrin repeat, SAM and basic leucine zipper domain-containing protein 1-like [Diadema antillarum]|uniref:ankyrin repeat, SAM and basic leucine zipper domain-containing protein 1-like n=1 Tax=Diadema antillarum TaxID=105358 RepID=UPI003A84CA51